MTTSALRHLHSTPFSGASAPITLLSAVAGKLGAGALALLRMSAGLNSVDPALFADRIVHD